MNNAPINCHIHLHNGRIDLGTESRHRGRSGDIWGLLVHTIYKHRELMRMEVTAFDILDKRYGTILLNGVEAVRKSRNERLQHGCACDGKVGRNQPVMI